ncbi:MAG: AAA family ATPase [Deltaproteobacteria bacterium]|nr:AAA family ATPase [Deltaproteobacteria bacterium]
MASLSFTEFWARGYRSLRGVEIRDLKQYNVFYGPNGSGKSNVLAAMRTLLQLAQCAATAPHGGDGHGALEAAGRALESGYLRADELCMREPSRTLVLGAAFRAGAPQCIEPLGLLKLSELSVEVTFDWALRDAPRLEISGLRWLGPQHGAKGDLLRLWTDPWPEGTEVHIVLRGGRALGQQEFRRAIAHLLVDVLPRQAYHLIEADRMPGREPPNAATLLHGGRAFSMQDHLRRGWIAPGLLAASKDEEIGVRDSLEKLRKFLEGEPLRRPRFDPVEIGSTRAAQLRERLQAADGEPRDVPLDLAGLGVVQIYSILAQALLSGARCIGLEEPEAHLHAPTTGLQLRQLLQRLVAEQHVDQLFVATHSNLFDLDPMGYFDFSLDDSGCTLVQRRGLDVLDEQHLYEPGPAKHALQLLLQYLPAEEVVFRRPEDGAPVTAGAMLLLLESRDRKALDFLRDVTGAALRSVRAKANRPAGA